MSLEKKTSKQFVSNPPAGPLWAICMENKRAQWDQNRRWGSCLGPVKFRLQLGDPLNRREDKIYESLFHIVGTFHGLYTYVISFILCTFIEHLLNINHCARCQGYKDKSLSTRCPETRHGDQPFKTQWQSYGIVAGWAISRLWADGQKATNPPLFLSPAFPSE